MCSFRSSAATDTGGAFVIVGGGGLGAAVSFQTCTFFRNRAWTSGGAVQVINAFVFFNDCDFQANSAAAGAAVFWRGGGVSMVNGSLVLNSDNANPFYTNFHSIVSPFLYLSYSHVLSYCFWVVVFVVVVVIFGVCWKI